MANVLVEEQYLQDVADSIRGKNGSSDTYTPAQMAQAISDIPTNSNGYTYGFTLGNQVQLSIYAQNYYVGRNQTVGSSISTTSSSNWHIARGSITKNKKYLCVTHHNDYDTTFVVTDTSNKVLYYTYNSTINRYPYGDIHNKMFLLDTSSFTNDEMYIWITMGKKSFSYFDLNNMSFTYSDSTGGLPVFVCEVNYSFPSGEIRWN